MPDNELLAAARNRLRRIHHGEAVEAVYAAPYTADHQTCQYDHPYHIDLRKVIGNDLAANPPDSDEPVSEEWFNQVGFDASFIDDWWQADYRGEDRLTILQEAIVIYDTDGSVNLKRQVRTRGDVRKVCDLASIPLTEPRHP